jgi:PIN domain nuclease of toxin-antitoxin system
MRLLLDTHIWLWGLIDPGQLGMQVRRALDDPNNELWLSPMSVWEALNLHNRCRVYLAGNAKEWIARNIAPFREAALTHEIAVASRYLRFTHEDPVDRFLVATAKVMDLTLVTASASLMELGEIATLPNR